MYDGLQVIDADAHKMEKQTLCDAKQTNGQGFRSCVSAYCVRWGEPFTALVTALG